MNWSTLIEKKEMFKTPFLLLLLLIVASLNAQQDANFTFSNLPDLLPNSGYETQKGLAGLYSGIDDNVIIVAGGANFPAELPWEGGKKTYYDEIFVLHKSSAESYSWKKSEVKLPFQSAYGGAISTHKGLFCFGGNTFDTSISATWFIDYLPEKGEVKIIKGPSLPMPLTNFAFAKVDDAIYIAGGISSPEKGSENSFFRLSLSENDPSNWKWEELPAWKGSPRAFSVAVSQSNGDNNCLYLFSGRNIQANKDPEILIDAHVYNPASKKWSVISDGSQKEFPFMAGAAFPIGASTIVFTSGADGKLMHQQIALEKEINVLKKDSAKVSKIGQLESNLLGHLNNHPGFGKEMIGFNTLTKALFKISNLPSLEQLTTSAIRWENDIVIASGEIRPGVRTPKVLKIEISKDNSNLSVWDSLVIAIYFLILAWMGYFFSKRQKTTDDYFKGGNRIPWWAAGLSVFGTALSAITFMAIPAKTFATDWSYFMLNMTIFLVAPLIVWLFIPQYRKLNVTTAYEYLEIRFGLLVRLIGSLTFILFQIGRMGVVLFLPSIALNIVSGIDIFVCIGLMGFVSLIYTIFGGIEAVIWTDVIQVVVLLGGALLALALMISNIDGGLQSIFETASANNKFNIVDLNLSLKQPTLWVMLLGGIFANISLYGTDQTMVQRYLTTKTQKDANKTVWTNAFLTIPASLIFFFVGTCLFVFYKSHPQSLNPIFESNDAIFPWFIISEMPDGISGLLIAAIFAASMSSLSSSMNSAATSYANDIHFRFGLSKMKPLKLAKLATLVLGLAGILFAFFMATADIKSLWDEFQKVLGLVIGGLGGVFLLGVLTKKANSVGVLVGLGISIVVQVLVALYQPVHLLVYSATGVISCFVFGFLASLLLGKSNTKNLSHS